MSSPAIPIGRTVRITGYAPGHALYLAEGTVEDYVASGTDAGDLAQVLLTRPRTSRGLLVHVTPARLEVRRRR